MNEISPINKYDENAYLAHVETILISENYWYLVTGTECRFLITSFQYSTILKQAKLKIIITLKYANLGLTSFLAFLFFIKLEKI